MITSYGLNNTFIIFNPLNAIYDCDMDTLETSICMVYNTKGMVLIAARMMEKIHLEGKQVEQKGTPFFVWLLKAYGDWGGRGFSRPTAGKGLKDR